MLEAGIVDTKNSRCALPTSCQLALALRKHLGPDYIIQCSSCFLQSGLDVELGLPCLRVGIGIWCETSSRISPSRPGDKYHVPES